MLSNGQIIFFVKNGEADPDFTPNFNRSHLQIQLKMQLDSYLFEVEIWHFDVDFGYRMTHHFISTLSRDNKYEEIRNAVNEWLTKIDPSWIVKELEMTKSPTYGEH